MLQNKQTQKHTSTKINGKTLRHDAATKNIHYSNKQAQTT